jgi:hypothetical protein
VGAAIEAQRASRLVEVERPKHPSEHMDPVAGASTTGPSPDTVPASA